MRQAFNLAFDFEWANKNLFYGQYARVGSYFQGSELAAPAALPQGRELEILNEVKDGVPPEVFTEVHANPVNDNTRRCASNLRKAGKLLKEAGYEVKNGVLDRHQDRAADDGRVPARLAAVRAHRAALCRATSTARHQEHDRAWSTSAQYTRRLNVFDYDIVVGNFAQSDSPGNEQRDFWGSEAAGREGSQNLIGVKEPGHRQARSTT